MKAIDIQKKLEDFRKELAVFSRKHNFALKADDGLTFNVYKGMIETDMTFFALLKDFEESVQEKVYIFHTEVVIGFDCLEPYTNDVYASKEEAVNMLKAWVAKEREHIAERGIVYSYEEGDTFFSAYEEGNYTENHSEAWVEETKLIR